MKKKVKDYKEEIQRLIKYSNEKGKIAGNGYKLIY